VSLGIGCLSPRLGRGTPLVTIQNATRGKDQNGLGIGNDSMFTLDGASQHAVAFQTSGYGASVDDNASTMQASYDRLSNQVYGAIQGMSVRRLTPRECERLQGFPDDYTLIQYRGKPAADGPRYRALGNSMAVPVIRWLGERIQMVENILKAASRAASQDDPSKRIPLNAS
jgi:DNA (cytosine-5)-methyltransferase 1